MEDKEIERLKEIFVTRRECDAHNQASTEHFAKLEISIAKIGTKLSIMMGILGAIGVAVAAAVVKIIFGG